MDQRLCQLCGNPFTYTTTRRKYCSEICSNQGRKRKEGIYAQKRTGQTTKTKINDAQKRICQMIDAGTACIVNINVPHKLSSWELFFESYNGGMGKTVKFVKHEDRWIKQKEIEDWSVEQWNTWYEGYKNVEDKTEAYYLMDVPLHTNHSRLLQNQNPLIDLFSYGGQYCFSRYIKMYSEDIPIPDLHYMAYIAPPWGQIMTYPHKDGHGTQLSVHCCVIGSGYNLVHCWPRLNMGQENDFRAILKIPPIGSKQEISHDIDYDKGVDSSITIWDVELAEQLAKKGIDDPTKFELHPGQAIILPPNQYHSFKKIHNQRQATMPLVGVACDCAYIGSTTETFLDNYTSMKGLQNVHHWSDHVYCILELCLYCLFQSLVDADPSELKSNSTMIAHAHGAYKLFVAWVETEVKTEAMVRENYNIESPVKMMENADEDLTCWKCKLPLVNLFCYTTEGHLKRYCIDCLTKVSKKRTGLALMCRLKTPKLLQKLLTAAQSILNISSQTVDDIVDLNQNEQTLSDNSSKKRKKSSITPMPSNKKLKTNPDTSSSPRTDSVI